MIVLSENSKKIDKKRLGEKEEDQGNIKRI